MVFYKKETKWKREIKDKKAKSIQNKTRKGKRNRKPTMLVISLNINVLSSLTKKRIVKLNLKKKNYLAMCQL